MNDSRLIELFGDIDEKYIKEAVAPNKIYIIRWTRIGVACLTLILLIIFCVPNIHEANDPMNPYSSFFLGDAPPHFYYHGSVYVCRGPYFDELPEGAVLIGTINNVGDTFSGIDFDGNAEGVIYKVPEDERMAYVHRTENGGEKSEKHPYVGFQQEQPRH